MGHLPMPPEGLGYLGQEAAAVGSRHCSELQAPLSWWWLQIMHCQPEALCTVPPELNIAASDAALSDSHQILQSIGVGHILCFERPLAQSGNSLGAA